jgi:ABC-type multidrug transport system permease subunit
MWQSLSNWLNQTFWGWHAVMVKEWIEILDDKFTLFVFLTIPIIQMIIYGYGVSFEVRHVDTVLMNLDRRPQSQILLDQLLSTEYFHITKNLFSREAVIQEIVSGRARAGIVIPPDFSDKLQAGRPGQIQVLIDGSDSTMANAVQNAAIAVGQNRSIQILTQLSQAKKIEQPIEMRPRMLFNPDVRTTNFILPGLVGFMAQTITLFLTVNSIVREREIGTLEQLLVTPVKPLGLMIGKLIPYLIIGFIGTNLLLAVMCLVFRVPVNGNIFLLEICIFIFVFVALAIGILISTAATNQAQAMHLASFVLIPSVLLSGFIFPRESMPLVLNWLGYAIPLTYFLQIQRGIVLRGAGVQDLWQWILPLLFFGFVLIYFSVKRFRTTVG